METHQIQPRQLENGEKCGDHLATAATLAQIFQQVVGPILGEQSQQPLELIADVEVLALDVHRSGMLALIAPDDLAKGTHSNRIL